MGPPGGGRTEISGRLKRRVGRAKAGEDLKGSLGDLVLSSLVGEL
jgi:hypothetical protein